MPDENTEVITLEQPNFDEFVQRGMELREKADNLQWEFGDLAVEFTRLMGKKFLPDFAKSIGIKVQTLRRYKDVSLAYPLKLRKEYEFLSWSHFREVAAHEDRYLLLQQAHDGEWSVEKLSYNAKPKAQEALVDPENQMPEKPELQYDREVHLWFIANAKEDGRHVKANLRAT